MHLNCNGAVIGKLLLV